MVATTDTRCQTSLAQRRSSNVARGRRDRILFVAEDMTLAHVGRMIALGGAAQDAGYDVRLACGSRFAQLVVDAGLRHLELPSMTPDYFAERLDGFTADDSWVYWSDRDSIRRAAR